MAYFGAKQELVTGVPGFERFIVGIFRAENAAKLKYGRMEMPWRNACQWVAIQKSVECSQGVAWLLTVGSLMVTPQLVVTAKVPFV